MMKTKSPGIFYALLAAALFGASTPLAKSLAGHIEPVLLAGLLYLGSGIGLSLWRFLVQPGEREASLTRRDWPWLAGAILFGGIIAPVLLMTGLLSTAAASASLLLNLEGVLTALLAWCVFRENFDRRIALGMLAIVAGGVLLSWKNQLHLESALGPLLIAGACLGWAIDNNLTRKVSGGDPLQITAVKGLAAGIVNTTLAFTVAGASVPGLYAIAGAAIVGFLGYGVSLTLFVLALRHLGTARTGAYFSIAPFVGASIAIWVFGEPVTAQFIAAAALMGIGVWLHVTERHAHQHTHEMMEHEHRHTHDEHHQHSHGPNDPSGEPHSHWHRHEPLTHAHSHYPDIHHRHSH